MASKLNYGCPVFQRIPYLLYDLIHGGVTFFRPCPSLDSSYGVSSV